MAIEYKGKRYETGQAIEKAGDGTLRYAARLLDLPGCTAQGSSPGEAAHRLEAMAPAFFEALLDIGAPIPDPTALPSLSLAALGFYDPDTGQTMLLPLGQLDEPLKLTEGTSPGFDLQLVA